MSFRIQNSRRKTLLKVVKCLHIGARDCTVPHRPKYTGKLIMEQHEYSALYLVIKIPNQDRIDHERYECIPSKWLKVKDEDENIVVFGFPSDDKLHTKLRVPEYLPLDNTWPSLYGEVVYSTDDQDDAFRFLKNKIDELESDSDQTKNKNDIVGEITTVCNEWGKDVDLEILEAHDIIRTYARDLEYEDTEFFSTNKILPIETDDEALNKEKKAKKIMERPRRKSTCQIASYAEFSDEEFDRSEDSDYDPEIEDPDSNEGIHNSPQPRTSGESMPVGVINSLDHQDITMNILDDPVHANLYNFYVDLNESFQKAMTSCDKAADYVHKIITARKEKVEAKGNQLSTDKHTETMNSIMFSHPQPLLHERVRVSDEDSKWTLRYPELGPGVIELLPNTGVYVSEEGLNKCKSSSSKTTNFTRSLLEEVFTDKALKTCAFSDRPRNKPGLNLKARQTLIRYALKYSLEMRWEKAEHKVITTCIRNKLTRSNKNKNKFY